MVEVVENWRPVRGFARRYEVSDLGRVRSLSTYRSNSGGILASWVQNKGYHYVTLRAPNGGKKSYAVHRLVLDAFVGICPAGHQGAHGDGDPGNNVLKNLRWATAKSNIADRSLHGRTKLGEENASSKLDRGSVKTIKRMKGLGFSAYETARLACVAPSTIDAIWAGEIWRHV